MAADCRINPAPAAAAANNAKLALTLQLTKWKWNATQCNKCSATLLVMSLKLTIFTRLNHLDIELQGFIFKILEQACKVCNLNEVTDIQNAMHNMRQLRHSCWSLCWQGEVMSVQLGGGGTKFTVENSAKKSWFDRRIAVKTFVIKKRNKTFMASFLFR